jgi:hypothetical protein
VRVVPACVHHRYIVAVLVGRTIGAGVWQPGRLLNRQRVHVGAHEHDRPFAVLQDSDHAGRADLLVHVVAVVAQQARHSGGRLDLLVAELWMPVQIPVEVFLPFLDRRLCGQHPVRRAAVIVSCHSFTTLS